MAPAFSKMAETVAAMYPTCYSLVSGGPNVVQCPEVQDFLQWAKENTTDQHLEKDKHKQWMAPTLDMVAGRHQVEAFTSDSTTMWTAGRGNKDPKTGRWDGDNCSIFMKSGVPIWAWWGGGFTGRCALEKVAKLLSSWSNPPRTM